MITRRVSLSGIETLQQINLSLWRCQVFNYSNWRSINSTCYYIPHILRPICQKGRLRNTGYCSTRYLFNNGRLLCSSLPDCAHHPGGHPARPLHPPTDGQASGTPAQQQPAPRPGLTHPLLLPLLLCAALPLDRGQLAHLRQPPVQANHPNTGEAVQTGCQ